MKTLCPPGAAFDAAERERRLPRRLPRQVAETVEAKTGLSHKEVRDLYARWVWQERRLRRRDALGHDDTDNGLRCMRACMHFVWQVPKVRASGPPLLLAVLRYAGSAGDVGPDAHRRAPLRRLRRRRQRRSPRWFCLRLASLRREPQQQSPSPACILRPSRASLRASVQLSFVEFASSLGIMMRGSEEEKLRLAFRILKPRCVASAVLAEGASPRIPQPRGDSLAM